MNLYDLGTNYQNVYDMEDIDEETWTDTLNAINEAIEDKADNIARLIRSLEADAEAYKNEAERLTAKKRVAENKIKSLKVYLQDNMERLDKRKFKTELFNFNIQNNPASAEITSEDNIPEAYYTLEKKFDKRRMAQDLKAGNQIAGAKLKQTQSLRIK